MYCSTLPGICPVPSRNVALCVFTCQCVHVQFGYLSDWINQLQAGNLASPCSPSLYHGMFDMGNHPAPALFSFDTALDLAVVVEGISASTTDPNDCGIAAAGEGLKLDGWLPFPLST
jgi:hypothetical protein